LEVAKKTDLDDDMMADEDSETANKKCEQLLGSLIGDQGRIALLAKLSTRSTIVQLLNLILGGIN
jgi:hypothetical protein